jgi:hypothetical protein
MVNYVGHTTQGMYRPAQSLWSQAILQEEEPAEKKQEERETVPMPEAPRMRIR